MEHITLGKPRGFIRLTSEGIKVFLDPRERALYYLFMNHPEGITADAIPRHRAELMELYVEETNTRRLFLLDERVDRLCSRRAFFQTVTNIKMKIVDALGYKKAEKYIIRRKYSRLYKIEAAGPSQSQDIRTLY